MGSDAKETNWDDIPWDNEEEDGGAIAEIPKALKRGFYGALESAGAAGEMFGIDAGEDLKDWAGEKARNPAIARPARLQEGTVIDHPERLIDPEWWVSIAGENLPNLVGMMIPGAAGYKGARLLGMGYKAAKTAGLIGGAAGSFTLESGAAYKDAKDEMLKMGYDEDRADQVATVEGLVVGTVNSLLEMAPFNALLSNPGGKKLLGRVIRQAWLEGGTEAVQENVNMLAARYGHDTDLTWKDQVGRTIESGLAGAVLGGPTGLFAGVDKSENAPPPPPPNNVIPKVEKSLGLSPTGLTSPNIEVVGREKTDLPQMMPEPKSAEESAQVFAQGLRPAVESYEVFEQAGMTKPEEQIARERNQQAIDRTNIDAENEIDQNEMIRRQYAQEFERRRIEAERRAKGQETAQRIQQAERGLTIPAQPAVEDTEWDEPTGAPVSTTPRGESAEALSGSKIPESEPQAEKRLTNEPQTAKAPWQITKAESTKFTKERVEYLQQQYDERYHATRQDVIDNAGPNKDDWFGSASEDVGANEARRQNKELFGELQKAKSRLTTQENKHRAAVKKAVREGLAVPADVLADYPDLAPKKPTAKNAPANDDLKKISETGLIQIAEHGPTDAPLNIFPVPDRDILKRNGLVYTDVETGSEMVQTDGLWKERDRRFKEASQKRHAAKSINDEIAEAESIIDTLEKRMARTNQDILDEHSLKDLKNQDRIEALEKTYERDLARHRTISEKLEKLKTTKKMQKGQKIVSAPAAKTADQPSVETVTAPTQAEASTQPPTLNEEGRRTDGKPILPGDVFLTATGRETTPYPKYSTKKSFKRDDVAAAEWTKENYRLEAESRGDDFNVTLANAIDPKNFTQSDGQGAMLYIFGDTELKKKQRPFLKPLAPQQPPTLPEDQRTSDKPGEPAASGQGQAEPKAKSAPKPKKQGAGPQTLRGRIKQMGGINFLNFKGELAQMPTAVKFLSKKTGIPIDTAEGTLRDEGWIGQDETLLDLLNSPDVLKRGPIYASDTAPQTKHQQAQQAAFDEQSIYEPESPPDGEYVTMKAEDLPEGTKLTIIDSRTLDGWDEYEVVDKDPFGITLKDGTTIELNPLDRVQVLASDLEKAPKKKLVDEAKTRAQIKRIVSDLKSATRRQPNGLYQASNQKIDTLYDDLKWKISDLRKQGDLDQATIDAIKSANVYDAKTLSEILPEANGKDATKAEGTKKLTYAQAVQANVEHMSAPASEWSAVPILGMEETDGPDGRPVSMPTFDFPKGYSNAPTLYKSASMNPNCEWCGTNIKRLFWIKNDDKKWVMSVGSECITHFGEGKSGERLAKEQVWEQNREFLRKAIAARKAVWDDYAVDNGRYYTKKEIINPNALEIYQNLRNIIGNLRADNNVIKGEASGDAAISRWVSANKKNASKYIDAAYDLIWNRTGKKPNFEKVTQPPKDATKAVQSTIDENEEPALFGEPERNKPKLAPKPKESKSDQEQNQLFGYNQPAMFDAEGKVKQAVADATVEVQRIQGGKKYTMKVPATEAMQEVADNKTAINRLKSMLDCL